MNAAMPRRDSCLHILYFCARAVYSDDYLEIPHGLNLENRSRRSTNDGLSKHILQNFVDHFQKLLGSLHNFLLRQPQAMLDIGDSILRSAQCVNTGQGSRSLVPLILYQTTIM